MLQTGKKYTLSELREALQESTNEFHPKMGDNVEKDNKKNNEKAVKEIAKEVEEFDGGVKQVKRNIQFPQDRNKTTLDLDFNETEPGKEWKDRVQAQAEGFVSVSDKEKNKVEEEAGIDRSGNKEIAKHFEEKNKERQDAEVDMKESGLVGRTEVMKKYTKSGSVCENKGMKRLNFKKTVFLSEAEAISKVPSEYRTDGNRFYVKDMTGTEYLMECKKDVFGYNRLSVINKTNKKQINEQLDRMKSLMGYNSKSYYTNGTIGQENSMIREGLDKVRLAESFAGWTQDPLTDWTVVNTPSDGDKLYKVGIWCGSGYQLDIVLAFANSEQHAVEYAVAYAEKNNPHILKDDEYERIASEDGEEAADSMFIYIDATMEGASQPHYIYAENAQVMLAPDDVKEKIEAKFEDENTEEAPEEGSEII